MRRLHKPSPAFVLALVALFVALGGTSYAALSIPANSVGSKQLKKNAVTTKKIKNGAVTASKLASSAQEPVAWAEVSASGSVIAGQGISSANVSRQSLAAYCFTGLKFAFKSAAVTIAYGFEEPPVTGASFAIGNPDSDCTSAQAEVATWYNDGYDPEPFFVQFFN